MHGIIPRFLILLLFDLEYSNIVLIGSLHFYQISTRLDFKESSTTPALDVLIALM
jgi:hypothetical protein